jgi:hypothetical protein
MKVKELSNFFQSIIWKRLFHFSAEFEMVKFARFHHFLGTFLDYFKYIKRLVFCDS